MKTDIEGRQKLGEKCTENKQLYKRKPLVKEARTLGPEYGITTLVKKGSV